MTMALLKKEDEIDEFGLELCGWIKMDSIDENTQHFKHDIFIKTETTYL